MFDREWVGSFLVRIALAGVLVWFAYYQIVAPDEWISFVPEWFITFATPYVPGITPSAVVMGVGIAQILVAFLYVIGRLVPVAGLLATAYFSILFLGHGFTHVGVRELALAVVALSTIFRS